MIDLNKALSELQKQFGEAIMLLSEDKVKPYPSISTGSPTLDDALGIGGLPIGKITEIFGEEACLSEDTHINYWCHDKKDNFFNTKGESIKRLYERFHELNKHHLAKKPAYFTVPSVNEENRIFHNLVHDVVKTGKKECFEVTTKTGLKIQATKDHKFMTQNGYLALEYLKVGDEVFVHNNTPYSGQSKALRRKEVYVKYHPKKRWKTVTANNKKGEQIYSYQRCRIAKSHAVYEAYRNGMSYKDYLYALNNWNKKKIDRLWIVPDNYHIHHKDENRDNNNLVNLVLIEEKKHLSKHMSKNHNKYRFMIVLDKIESIKSVGIKETYDIKCYYPYNNYVANKFVVHNSGKSTLALSVIAQAQKRNFNCAFLDAEHVLDLNRVKALGIQLDKLIFAQPDYGEQALEMVDGITRSGTVKVIAVDSVAALIPKSELEGDIGDSPMASQARLMSQAMRKLVGVINKMGVLLIFTNQLRSNITSFGYGGKVTSGGNSLKYYASVRLEMKKRGENTDAEGRLISTDHVIKIRKNKFAPPFKSITTQIDEHGFNFGAELIDLALKKNIIHRAGAYYKMGDKIIGQGKQATINAVHDNEELIKKIMKLV